MTKHAVEALFVGLAFLAAVPLATRREFQCVLVALAVAAFIVGLVLTINGA
jgi:hypothetical protein